MIQKLRLHLLVLLFALLTSTTLAKLPPQEPPKDGWSRSYSNESDEYDSKPAIGQSKAANINERNDFDKSSNAEDVVDSIRSLSYQQSQMSETTRSNQHSGITNKAYNSYGLQYRDAGTVNVYVDANGNAVPPNATGAVPGNPLMKKMSSASLSGLFLFMCWRDAACYDLALQFESPFLRILTSTGSMGLLLLNLLGCVLNLIQPFKYKGYLKIILAGNTMREVIEIAYYILMFLISPGGPQTTSSLSPAFESVHENSKDTYLGRIVTTLYVLLLCISATRMRWVKEPVKPTGTNLAPNPNLISRATYAAPQSYDDRDDNYGYSDSNDTRNSF